MAIEPTNRPGLFVEKTDPASPVRAEAWWFDSTAAALKTWDGSQWASITGATFPTTSHAIFSFANRATDPPLAFVGPGDLWFPSDGMYYERYENRFEQWAPGASDSMVEPNAQNFTWVNQGPATIVADSASIYLEKIGASANRAVYLQVTTKPPVPYVINMVFAPPNTAGNGLFGFGFGVGWYQTTANVNGWSGSIYFASILSGGNVAIETFANPTSFAGVTTTRAVDQVPYSSPIFLRMMDDGVSKSVHWSVDGQHFKLVSSWTGTAFLNAADMVCFGVRTENGAGVVIGATLISWQVSSNS